MIRELEETFINFKEKCAYRVTWSIKVSGSLEWIHLFELWHEWNLFADAERVGKAVFFKEGGTKGVYKWSWGSGPALSWWEVKHNVYKSDAYKYQVVFRIYKAKDLVNLPLRTAFKCHKDWQCKVAWMKILRSKTKPQILHKQDLNDLKWL